MNQFSFKPFYRRKLPHIQPDGATLFVTFRLANSLPADVVEQLKTEKERINLDLEKIIDRKERERQSDLENHRYFGKWDEALNLGTGKKYLSNLDVANMVAESLHYRDGKVYDLIAFSIMPNHVHLVITPIETLEGKVYSLSTIMHSLKRHTARQANLILGQEGYFWQHENYDHFARDIAELERIISYVLENPVKAGLVDDPTKWQWSYSKYEM
jgi:putative transposase